MISAKEYLIQPKDLDEVIRKQTLEMETWRDLATSLSIDYSKENTNPNHSTHAPYEKCIENACELEQAISANTKKLAEMKLTIAEEIQALDGDDADEKDDMLILMMRYIGFMKWEDIEDKFVLSESMIMKKHQKALSRFECVHAEKLKMLSG